jgi:glycosyl transferase family 87
VAAACALFVGSCSLLHHGFFEHAGSSDVKVYIQYGRAVAHGKAPYHDFRLEYPPAAVAVFAAPALLDVRRPGYDHWFEREMLALGCLMIIGVALCLHAAGATRLDVVLALAFTGLTPLLIGPVMLTRYDLWPTTLTVFAVAALLAERRSTAAVLFGLAVAAKLWPAMLLPIAFLWVLRHGGRHAAVGFSAVTAAVVAALFVPFAVFAPTGLMFSFHRQFGRPLQVESFGSTLLIAVHHVTNLRIGTNSGWGSDNLAGPGVHATQVATTAIQVVTLLLVCLLFARGPATHSRLLTACAASIASFLAFGKVFSPQFVIWVAPFCALLLSRRRVMPALLGAGVFVLTQIEYPHHYKQFALFFHTGPVFDVLLRNLSVVALAALLSWSLHTSIHLGDTHDPYNTGFPHR